MAAQPEAQPSITRPDTLQGRPSEVIKRYFVCFSGVVSSFLLVRCIVDVVHVIQARWIICDIISKSSLISEFELRAMKDSRRKYFYCAFVVLVDICSFLSSARIVAFFRKCPASCNFDTFSSTPNSLLCQFLSIFPGAPCNASLIWKPRVA